MKAVVKALPVDMSNANIKITAISAFAVKDELKARGYRFDHEALWIDPLGQRSLPGWERTMPGTDAAAIAAELDWLENLGEVEIKDEDTFWHYFGDKL